MTINQPRFMPALSYIARMYLADVFIYLDSVRFSPGDWENRNKIKTANGPIWLTIPVKRVTRETPISRIEVNYESNWTRKHLAAIEQSYGKAPFFDEFYPSLLTIYETHHIHLADFNIQITQWLCNVWDCNPGRRVRASTLAVEHEKGQELLADLVLAVGGTNYISGPLGRNYVVAGYFPSRGIDVSYHDYQHPEYIQQHGEFAPFMGAIDLLFMHGKAGREILLQGNKGRDSLTPGA